ncbi:hypothetical protein B0T10DRAFT_554158 [Thelonectria olida]|uniref:Uncharacterized protein n=1 Tax=Thelonectria olida TaxID=1576542 RepID=A0A9P9ADL5_9HYPO|nr:hypothetical protein B0T10DRAFT_554158 [Thelonectria olida]
MQISEAAKRLFWTLQGPLESSIFVLEDVNNPLGPREPYCRQASAETSWHPISQEPLTQSRETSLSVRISPLDTWKLDWFESHEHADPDDPSCVYELVNGHMSLVQCCGEDKPTNLAPFAVKVSDKPYLSIHDFITAVHPVLMGLRQDLLAALGIPDGRPLPEEIRLMVDCSLGDWLRIKQEDEWTREMRFRHRHQQAHPPADPEPPVPSGPPRPPNSEPVPVMSFEEATALHALLGLGPIVPRGQGS